MAAFEPVATCSLGSDDDGEMRAYVDGQGRLWFEAFVTDKDTGEERREPTLDGMMTVDQVEVLRRFLNNRAMERFVFGDNAASPPPAVPQGPAPPSKGDVWITRDGREWVFTGKLGYDGVSMELNTSIASHFDGTGYTGRAFSRSAFTDGTLTFVRAAVPQGEP
jgi:hypothetical protein